MKGDLFVVASANNGSDVCVRRATAQEMAEDWGMAYDEAVSFAKWKASQNQCKWFDFSTDPAPMERAS